jgi:ankyrin repeat protein
MKKTIFTVTAFCTLLIATAVAKTETSNNPTDVTTSIVKKEPSTFCKAIMNGDINTVKRLIDLGEDVNSKSLGMTPAIFAARYNKVEILKVLIDNQADLTIRCNKGWSIEKYAKISNAKDVLEVLKDNV